MTVAMAVATALAAGSGAQAQEESAQSGGLEEIVVTARKREESLQSAPVSVTAFTSEMLQETGAASLAALRTLTPNVQFQQNASATTAGVFIRGIGQSDFLLTSDPGVGIYVDGVYLARTYGSVLDLLDVERIEVLRGPQGTLFGKNTIGGAVNVITAQPLDKFYGKAQAQFGSRNRVDVDGIANFPLVPETLAAKLAFSSRTQDGYVNAPNIGQNDNKTNDTNRQTVRGALRWQAAENVYVTVGGDYSRQRQAFADVHNFGLNRDGSANTRAYEALALNPQGLSFNTDYSSGPYTTLGSDDSFDNLDGWGTNLTANWQIGAATLKSITAYRDLTWWHGNDMDGTPLEINGTVRTDNWQHQFSQELQVTGTTFGDRMTYAAGLFYMKEKARDIANIRAFHGTRAALEALPARTFPSNFSFAPGYVNPCNGTAPGAPGNVVCLGGAGNLANRILDFEFDASRSQETTSYAAYAQSTFKVTERLSATAGVRQSKDEKDLIFNQVAFFDQFKSLDNAPGSDSWSSFTPRVGLEFQATPDHLLYVSAARGFKSGGFNGRPISVLSILPYNPEYVWTYEAGFKSEWFDHRLRFNTSAFFMDYTDIQVQLIEADPVTGIRIVVRNPGDGEMRGFESELVAVPVRGLTLSAGIGMTDWKYTEIRQQIPGVTLNSERTDLPKWQGNVAAEYTFSLSNESQLQFRTDAYHQTKVFFDAANNPILTQPGYTLVNGRVSFIGPSDKWQVYVFGKNLTDKTYRLFASSTTFGYSQELIAPPREWGLGARFTF